MKIAPLNLVAASLIGVGAVVHDAAAATVVAKEPTTLRIGERVLVDDGSCPTGQIREVVGVSSKAPGSEQIERLSQCIMRKQTR